MSNAFVAIDEGVIEDEGETERCGNFGAVERGRLKGIDVSNSACTTLPF